MQQRRGLLAKVGVTWIIFVLGIASATILVPLPGCFADQVPSTSSGLDFFLGLVFAYLEGAIGALAMVVSFLVYAGVTFTAFIKSNRKAGGYLLLLPILSLGTFVYLNIVDPAMIPEDARMGYVHPVPYWLSFAFFSIILLIQIGVSFILLWRLSETNRKIAQFGLISFLFSLAIYLFRDFAATFC
jgi:hypothetical protein